MRLFLPRALFVCAALSLFSVAASAQPQLNAPPSIDESRRVVLHGTVHPLAQPRYDRGAVSDSFSADRMLIMLKRNPARDQALQKFLRDAHTPGSPAFHHWLTPDEFGAQFGANDADIQTISNWLQAHGFRVNRISRGKSLLEFSGTAAQVREVLQSEIHEYNLEGTAYYAVASEVSVPEEISAIIRGFAPLNTFPLANYVHTAGAATLSRASDRAKPQFTLTENNLPFYAVAPSDFATQYNLTPVYSAGLDGTGQTIGILGENNIDLGRVTAYRQLFSLPGNNTQVIIDGEDPGDGSSANTEGFLDVELSGAVAPKATINFYIAGGTHFQSLFTLAAVRAVEDDQASVISASFGECEPLLGNTGNEFYAGLWEQAAAQGQTVLAASGDSGPANCPVILLSVDTGPIQTFTFVPSINGLASTPWNIAVGGTDFYYPDYASGAPSMATDWSATNSATFGSLNGPLAEQPWDNTFGLNVVPSTSLTSGVFSFSSGSSGGGPSNCSTSTGTIQTQLTCVSGYPKPAWQNAPGIPVDGVRDVPDVSLFASPGANFSAYPICVSSSDCVPSASAAPQVLLVGGTSASTPAMAGILALINQKYGRQGQANFTIYGLARQQPSIFHDITVGTNDNLCPSSYYTCVDTPVPGRSGITLPSYGIYPAGTGYDLASGLGSFDANALITNWNKVTYQPSSTTLQVSPASIVHGSSVTVSTTVSATSGSSVPTGDVDIQISTPLPLPQNAPLQLSSGAATAAISDFPGGTYQVTAQYAGDGVFAPSTSAGSTLTVTPEPSVTQLNLHYMYFDGTANQSGQVQAGAQVPFGSEWTFTAQPTGQTSNSTAPGTGSVTFTDGSISTTVPLNTGGIAAWSPADLAMGSHSVTASYSGDPSYNPSTAGPLTFTVGKGTPRLIINPEQITIVTISGSTQTPPQMTAGADLTVFVAVESTTSLVPPTGTVTVTLASATTSSTQTGALVSSQYLTRSAGTTLVTFPAVPAGMYTLSASYAGDNNWNSTSYTDPNQLNFVAMRTSPTTLSLALSPSSVNGSQSVTFTATLQATASQSFFGGSIILFANNAPFASAVLLPTVPPTNSNSATASVAVPASVLPAGNLQIVAHFDGSPNLLPSTSAPVPLTVTPTDFQMNLSQTGLTLKSGTTGSVPLQLNGPNGGSVSVQLSCLPSSSTFTCSVAPSSASLSGSATASITIKAFTMLISTPVAQHTSPHVSYLSATLSLFTCVLLFLLPRKRLRSALLLLLVACVLTFASCGGGSSPPPPPPPQQFNTPAGSYSAVVTAQSAATTHNVKLSVQVQ